MPSRPSPGGDGQPWQACPAHRRWLGSEGRGGSWRSSEGGRASQEPGRGTLWRARGQRGLLCGLEMNLVSAGVALHLPALSPSSHVIPTHPHSSPWSLGLVGACPCHSPPSPHTVPPSVSSTQNGTRTPLLWDLGPGASPGLPGTHLLPLIGEGGSGVPEFDLILPPHPGVSQHPSFPRGEVAASPPPPKVQPHQQGPSCLAAPSPSLPGAPRDTPGHPGSQCAGSEAQG